MLDTTQLPGEAIAVSTREKPQLQHHVTGKTAYHVFKTLQGKEKRLSQTATVKDVWLEIVHN